VLQDLTALSESIAAAFEAIGVFVIVIGFIWAIAAGLRALFKTGTTAAYVAVRGVFGRGVLLGLEVLVGADLIRTIAVAPTLTNLLVLGLLVLVRTFLSWSFSVELEGMWPWQKRAIELRERCAEQGATEQGVSG
jgi:uncharacterized membrane protein